MDTDENKTQEMAWDDQNGKKDPWGGGRGNQDPPDLDEVVKKLQDKMGGLFGGKKSGGGDSGPPVGGGKLSGNLGGIGLIIGIVLLVLLVVKSFYIVQPAERGVVLRFGAYSEVTEPGPHLLIPFVDTVDVVNVDQVNKFPHRAQMLTRDENIVDLTLTVQYLIQDPADYLFQDASPEKTIIGAMESALREIIGKSTLDDIITTNRVGIALSVMEGTQRLLDLYRTGLKIANVNFQDASPPDAVREAFDDAIKAREDKVKVQNQAETYANDIVPRARGSAARQIEDAKGYSAKIVAEAEGESQRFLALLKEYEKAPRVTRDRLYLGAMEEVLKNSTKVLLDVKGGNNLTYLPLDRIVRSVNTEEDNKDSPDYASKSGNPEQSINQRESNRSRRIR